MKKRFSWALVAGCLLAVILAGCEKKGPSGFERPPASVSVATAAAKDVPVYLDSIGKCVAREVVSIQPQVSGRITGIHFEDGQDVKKGDPLFTIDPRPYKADLLKAEATLAQHKALRELAKIQFDRYAELLQTKSVSQFDYDQRKNTLDVADAQVQQSEAAVETAKISLAYCYIHSPIDGRTGQRLVDIGNVVAANTGSLLMIQRMNPIYADFTIPENDLSTVQQNMQQGTLKVEVSLPTGEEKPREGQLTFLDNTVQEGTGTVKLRATIANEDRHFWPGRFVKVRLVLETIHNAVLIPAAAPQMAAKGTFVYVVKDDSTAELRPVQLGQQQEGSVVVTQGLKPGERVIVQGQIAVMPGAKVNVDEARAPAKSPEAAPEGGKS
ncbi:MAG: efflux RND transporter periplasmic adaptor subunit [Desulfomonile tiedjei]|nr:efflux RND transporter periplasmic adaptor subunit [Desulfomonile tiedjei]